MTVNLSDTNAETGGDAQGDTLENIENLTGSRQGVNVLIGNHLVNILRGGVDNDEIRGLDGDDTLDGGSGDDTLDGGSGDDTLIGGFDHDILRGGPGDDTLDGGSGPDELPGGPGDDTLIGGPGPDELRGGDDIDTADYSASNAGVTINLSDTNNESGGHAQGDTLLNVEIIVGSGHDDTLTGDASNNILEGGPGADALTGGAGSDTASYAGASAAVTVDLAASTNNTGEADGDTFTGIENVTGSAHDDTLTGDASNNILEGGPGADALTGGAGSDTAGYAGASAAVTVDLATPANNSGDAAGDAYTGIENVTGSAHDDTLTGDADANILVGGPGADTLNGGDGDDTASYADSDVGVVVNLAVNALSGGHAAGDTLNNIEKIIGSAHNDVLTGDNSANSLTGGAGSDILNGWAGDDTLTGGDGADEFRFSAGFGNDTIADYTLGASKAASEKIRLCMGTAENPPTHAGADSGSDHVITVTFNGATAGTITLRGITTASANFGNLNVRIFTAHRDGTCDLPLLTPEPQPLQVWFIASEGNITPHFVSSLSRIYVYTSANRDEDVTVNCVIDDGTVACPPGTVVSLPVTGANAGDKHQVSVTVTSGGQAASRSHELLVGGPKQPWVWASGGSGTLLVGWDESPDPVTGAIDAYVVQRRQQNQDGTWPDWSDDNKVVKTATDREHTFTGLAHGTWQVRVRARNDAGDTDASTHILGTTSEVRTVTLASAHTNRPEPPAAARAVPGQGTLTVEWHPPATETGSVVYGYAVRHKIASAPDSAYVETAAHPRRVDVECGPEGCESPRTLEITGLTTGAEYTVQIQSRNANGGSDWLTVGTFGIYVDPNAPRNLRTQADNDLGIFVWWDAPQEGSPAGYVVEWQADDGSAAQTSALLGAGKRNHHIHGLDDGKTYTVRVAARDAGDNDNYSSPSSPVAAWWEPLQVWWDDGTPILVTRFGDIFLQLGTNKHRSSRDLHHQWQRRHLLSPQPHQVSIQTGRSVQYRCYR